MNILLSSLVLTSLLTAAPQGGGGPGSQHLGQSLVILSTTETPPLEFPGVFGRLRLDLASAIVVPFDENQASVVDTLEAFGPAAQAFSFQILRPDESGYHLSHVRRVGEDSELRFSQQETAAFCRRLAELCIAEATGTEMAESWQGQPIITRTTPLYRPDVAGIAYFEFAVDQGGFVIVATGDHDDPIPNWGCDGPSPSAQLRSTGRSQGRVIQRFYKIDSMAVVAEDANGQLIAVAGEMPRQLHDVPARVDENTPDFQPLARAWPSWRALKAGYSESYRPYLRRAHQKAVERWDADRTESFTDSGWGSWTTYTADGGSSEQPRYYQFDYGGCAVGCGPVAWAILFAWGDRQAHAGNPDWSARTGLYRTNGGTSAGGASASAVAPLTQTTGIETVIREINGWVDTFCLAGSGATLPHDMDEAQGYLNSRTGADCTGTDSDTFITTKSKRESARNSIRDRDTPVIIGNTMGGGLHYPVAFKYRWRSKTTWLGIKKYDREFYVNPGWGSSSEFQWVNAKTWFVGQLYP